MVKWRKLLTFLYQFIVLGNPSIEQVAELEEFISQALESFELRIGREVEWFVSPQVINLKQQQATAAVFFGGDDVSADCLQTLLDRNIPILPVVSDLTKVHMEIPPVLRPLNCLSYQDGGSARVGTALLECVGLLPRQRRVFLSYRRDESRQAALQLFEKLSARMFDVFLDTHGVAPSADFQAMLWHRLCDSDVLLMLDTPNYFASRWTSAEFGRALAKGIEILRIGWVGVIPSALTATASCINLAVDDIDLDTGNLTDRAISDICLQLEAVRSRSHAVRNLNLLSNIRLDIERVGGSVAGVGINKSVYIRLPNGNDLVVYPTVGVPTATTLHDAMKSSPDRNVAVVFDYVGLHQDCLEHLDWLGIHIRSARLLKANESAWHFADWEV
jgi:hypothetical protein